MKINREINAILSLIIAIAFMLIPLTVFAAETKATDGTLHYSLGEVEKTDDEYTSKGSIDKNDPHSGWTLGTFDISGYTVVTADDKNNTVFLKNVGDEVTFSFTLNQNIDKLNGDETKYIASVTDGYDKTFDYSEATFGQGFLIVQQTNYQNNKTRTYYSNFLKAKTVGANTEIKLLEEGDYEVTLDYCIADGYAPFGITKLGDHRILPSYDYYRIHFRFSVRNGNCMVFPYDSLTKGELTNSAYTENGFYLDLKNSRYLVTNIKKETLNEGKDGLDTRFNRPAKDGEEYIDEGIYTIIVTNLTTKQQTSKTIYVGTNPILKAYAKYSSIGLSIEKINTLIQNGTTIAEDGTINDKVVSLSTVEEETTEEINLEHPTETVTETITKKLADNFDIKLAAVAGGAVIVLILIAVIVIKSKKKKKAKSGKEKKEKGFEDIYSN